MAAYGEYLLAADNMGIWFVFGLGHMGVRVGLTDTTAASLYRASDMSLPIERAAVCYASTPA
jgi:hypothetical protein